MARPLRWLIPALGLALLLGPTVRADAQADPQNFQFNSGQNIQPFFDGWSHNPDGSFEFYFGYLNRNYVEELQVPVGANNHLTPDDQNRDQPTYFYPRRHTRVFSVTVPSDWGDREVVWQVTVGDEPQRAVGWLQPEWEIDANAAANRLSPEVVEANQAPSLTINAPATGSVGNPLALTAMISDDGLPEPRPRGPRGPPNVVPTFERQTDGPTLPVNVPQLQGNSRHRPTQTRVERINVTWMQMHGPTGARLETEEEPEGNVSTVTASFQQAGEYVFRVRASDGPTAVTEDLSITIR